MKKIINLILVFAMLMGTAVFADIKTNEHEHSGLEVNHIHDDKDKDKDKDKDIIVVESREEINHELLKQGYTYRIIGPSRLRSACVNCGSFNTYTYTDVVQTDWDYHECPKYGPSMGSSDIIFSHDENTYQACNNCGNDVMYDFANSYLTECHFGEMDYQTYNVGQYKTVAQGYDEHECWDAYDNFTFFWHN